MVERADGTRALPERTRSIGAASVTRAPRDYLSRASKKSGPCREFGNGLLINVCGLASSGNVREPREIMLLQVRDRLIAVC